MGEKVAEPPVKSNDATVNDSVKPHSSSDKTANQSETIQVDNKHEHADDSLRGKETNKDINTTKEERTETSKQSKKAGYRIRDDQSVGQKKEDQPNDNAKTSLV